MPVAHDCDAVDEDVRDADGIPVRILIRRHIRDGRRVEDDDIGVPAIAELAAIAKAEARRRQLRRSAYRLFEPQQPLSMRRWAMP